MLTREGIEESIVGHSERRTIFAETDEMIRKKVETGLEKGMRIVLCVGETLELREKSEHFSFVRSQLESALKGLSVKNSEKLVIAYEPVWAIGTGRTAAPAQAQEMHAFIRKELCDMGLAGESIRIIYGGSVKPSNVRELMACADIDGALVGGASLKAEDFHSLVHY
jgi:triosephosphate isomerase